MPGKHFLFFTVIVLLCPGCGVNPYPQGHNLYAYHCAGCHAEDGSGLGHLIPPLDSSSESFRSPATLICLIKNGLPLDTLTGQKMPPNSTLNEVEMTNLVNYLGHRFKGIPQWVRVPDAARMYAACQTR